MTNRSPYSGFYVVDPKYRYISGPWQRLQDAHGDAAVRLEDTGIDHQVVDPEEVVDMPDLDYDARQAAWDREEDMRVEAAIDERRGV